MGGSSDIWTSTHDSTRSVANSVDWSECRVATGVDVLVALAVWPGSCSVALSRVGREIVEKKVSYSAGMG